MKSIDAPIRKEMDENAKLGFLNILIFVLSVYVLVALFIDTIVKLPVETSRLLYYIDNAVCIIFFYDFCVRFYRAPSKWQFMKWGWLDLISCAPTLEYLRPGRIIRLIRVLRIMRAFRSVKNLIEHIYKNKIEGTFTTVSIIAILLIIFSSIAILQVEKDPNSNIKTAEDAIWWAYVTITTVGYGDKYPVTTEGRIIACILMTAGVGLFGTFTAYISSIFLSSQNKSNTR